MKKSQELSKHKRMEKNVENLKLQIVENNKTSKKKNVVQSWYS